MAELHIDLLGGLRVRTATGRDIRIASRKAQALLGCLALKPGSGTVPRLETRCAS